MGLSINQPSFLPLALLLAETNWCNDAATFVSLAAVCTLLLSPPDFVS